VDVPAVLLQETDLLAEVATAPAATVTAVMSATG
jgi:hypothetical protein